MLNREVVNKKIGLASGIYNIRVTHEVVNVPLYGSRIATDVILEDGDYYLKGMSFCNPIDFFDDLSGRRSAAIDLLKNMKAQFFETQDRDAVFAAICPELR